MIQRSGGTWCVLGLGSNKPWQGMDRLALIRAAAESLSGILENGALSPVYETAPLHVTGQGPFLNAAVSGTFSGTARELLCHAGKIEARYGRNRSSERRWGERSLDIDILLFGENSIAEDDLVIPHPRLTERAFALRPLLDLAPGLIEPGTGRPYAGFLAELGEGGVWLYHDG